MKKFIKALEDKAIMETIIDSAIITEKMTGKSIEQGRLEMILDFHMSMDKDLEDSFLHEAHAIALNSIFKYVQRQIVERQKVEALDSVDFNALFAKAVKKTSSEEEVKNEKSKDMDEKIEEVILNSMSKALDNMLSDMLKNMFDDCK